MSSFQQYPEHWVVQPDSLGTVTLGVTISLGISSIFVVILRIHSRILNNTIGIDDYLMIAGCLLYNVCCAFIYVDVYAGLGTRDVNLPDASSGHVWNYTMGVKWFAFFQYGYCWTLPFIKASIGVAILRITPQKRYRYPTMAIIGASASCTLIGFILLMTICQPLNKTWLGDLVEGTCTSASLYSIFSYIVSIVTLVTDLGCIIIPAFVVWGGGPVRALAVPSLQHLQMPRNVKVAAFCVLSLGAVAGISTIVRLPYLVGYTATTDILYHKANIAVWSMVEMGVGIIAGSMPALYRVARQWLGLSMLVPGTDQNPNVPLNGRQQNVVRLDSDSRIGISMGSLGVQSCSRTVIEADHCSSDWNARGGKGGSQDNIITVMDLNHSAEFFNVWRGDMMAPEIPDLSR